MKQVWALTDHRKGTANQVLGVAQNTGFNVIEKKLIYNKIANLPNGLQQILGIKGIAKISRTYLSPPYPDLIVSAGRRSAVIACYLKKKHPSIKLVHIMSPELPFSRFDLLVLPKHDKFSSHKNVVTTLGAPNILNDALLAQEQTRNPLGHFITPKPWTMICIGGNTSFGRFTLSDVKNMVAQLKPIADEGGTWLITSSRRTPAAIFHTSLEWIAAAYPDINIKSYSPEQSAEENPYYSWIAQAERFVVTADSVSMISEAAFTLKPIYIFTPKDAAGQKHLHFTEDMKLNQYARDLSDYNPNWTRDNRLNEAQRIGKIARKLVEGNANE